MSETDTKARKLNDLTVNVRLAKDSDMVCVICRKPVDLASVLLLLDHKLLFAGAPDAIFVYCGQGCLSADALDGSDSPTNITEGQYR